MSSIHEFKPPEIAPLSPRTSTFSRQDSFCLEPSDTLPDIPDSPRNRVGTLELEVKTPSPNENPENSSVDNSKNSLIAYQVKDIRFSGAKKIIGSMLLLAGGLRNILNLPILKQTCELISLGGGLIGGSIGLAAGFIGGNTSKGAILGGKIGMALLDPRSIFKGFSSAGDWFLKNSDASLKTRTTMHNISYGNLDANKGRLEIIENDLKDILQEAAKNSGKTKEEAKYLVDQWMIAVKNDYQFQKIDRLPPRKPKVIRLGNRELNDWKNNKLPNWKKQYEINKCLAARSELDKILLTQSKNISFGSGLYSGSPIQKLNVLMQEVKELNLNDETLDSLNKIDTSLHIAMSSPTHRFNACASEINRILIENIQPSGIGKNDIVRWLQVTMNNDWTDYSSQEKINKILFSKDQIRSGHPLLNKINLQLNELKKLYPDQITLFFKVQEELFSHAMPDEDSLNYFGTNPSD